ncbi:MAG: hypothetical protein C0403_01230 [Desulfobacterium sp.]|nr:hypothetical protein [Desulfobacterium sp.]
MNITLINGNDPGQNKGFEDYMSRLNNELVHNHDVEWFHLQALSIKDCLGCFGCWQKTPGQCIFKDDMASLIIAYLHSDLVLFASPLILGFPSALLKTSHDRLIPIIHPYTEIKNGELHHEARYKKYPKLGLLMEKEVDTDEEDIKIITDIYTRIAFSFKSALVYLTFINTKSPEEIAHEIGHC